MFGGEQAISPAQLALSRVIARQTFLSSFVFTAGFIRVLPFAFDLVQSLWQ